MSRLKTSLILGSGLDYHRRLDEREQDGRDPAVSQRTDIENGQVLGLAEALNEGWG
jgi:hypothetical protein